jgi:hypothetical protein
LETEEEVLSEITKIFQMIEAQKKKEQELQKDRKVGISSNEPDY